MPACGNYMIDDILAHSHQFGACHAKYVSPVSAGPVYTHDPNFAIIDLFHNNFSPGGEQPKHRKLAHEL